MSCSEHDTWTTVDVGAWSSAHADEPLGTKTKFWVKDPAGRRWLFKSARVHGDAASGEDWAECIVHELAMLLGVPTAHANLASDHGRRGVVSLSVVDGSQRLEHGNELLAAADPVYDKSLARENPGYTVSAVKASLNGIEAPNGWQLPGMMTGFDVWCGYLLLDAWVAGRDRHHENWGAIREGLSRRLAPSFDHGNALGFQESDRNRARMCDDDEALLRWVRRGTSPHFAGRPSLVSLAAEALELAGSGVRPYWLDRLDAVTLSQVSDALARVPDELLSDAGRSFCVKVLTFNRERIVRGDPGGS